MAISLIDEKNTVYGKGDICLKINPFDNYRKFTLYENWKDDDRKVIDVSGEQKFFLVFKSKKKEIRIPEYESYTTNLVDKSNGEVLFKISKKNAIDILGMDDRIFYITRTYEKTDMTGSNVISSDEEVVYTGQWKDESSDIAENYTSKIKSLMKLIDDRNQQIQNLQTTNAQLMEQNVNFASQLETFKDENDKLSMLISELESKIVKYESGETYDGQILDNNGTILHITSEQVLSEDAWEKIVKDGLNKQYAQ